MTQDCASTNKIKENKYKILRMSLLLGSDEDRVETLNNFEDASREIDNMNDEIYLKDLEDKFYDTTTLEEEEKKLVVLVEYIGGRVEQRISLLSDFANVTGFDLTDLPPIKYYDKLDDYKERLKYIREYLHNIDQITILNQEIIESENKLKDAYLSKETSEEYNQRNEEILLNKFENLLKTTDLKEINDTNIDLKLNEIIGQVEDSKKSLDIFNKSFATLSGSGISFDEEQEYKSYVDNAKELYYSNKEQEYLLRIYKYLLKKEFEYNALILKRETINSILYERLDLRRELNVKDNDILNNIYDVLERQYEDIKRQKNNIENIEILTENITQMKIQLNDLEIDNQKVEILALLREYGLIETYNDENDPEEQFVEDSNEFASSELETNNSFIFEESDNKDDELITEKVEEEAVEDSKEDIISDIDIFDMPNIPIPDDIITKQEENKKDNEIITEDKTIKVDETIKEDEIAKENEVTLVENSTNIDLELVHSKANKVMQRVGEMLGIKTVDTKIVSVENKIEKEEVEEKEEPPMVEEKTAEPPISENPLFNNNITNQETVEPEEEISNFWFESETPDALSALPDLEVSNDNFFANNNIPDLNFPDLKINFGPDEEVK